MRTRSGTKLDVVVERTVAPLGRIVKLHANSGAFVDCLLPFYPHVGAESGGFEYRLALFAAPGNSASEAPDLRVEGRNIFVSADGITAHADASARAGICEASEAWFETPERLVAEVIDPLLLFMLSHDGRTPVHASAVIMGDRAVVLAGRSGSGKSTLALAALRAGLPVLSDDTVYVQLAPRFSVWSLRRPIHVVAADAPPDTSGPLRLRSGKWKAAVERRSSDPCVSRRSVLCMLERGNRVELRPIDPEHAINVLTEQLEPGFDLFRTELPRVLRTIGAEGTWRLQLSHDPDEALAALSAQFGSG